MATSRLMAFRHMATFSQRRIPRPSLKATGIATVIISSVGVAAFYITHPMPQLQTDPSKKTIVVLGTGWGAVSILQNLDTSEYNTVVVSPRNYFLFTPLLPSVTTGSLDSRSIITPIKYFLRFKPFGISFIEADATDIDPFGKSIEIKDNSEVTGVVSTTRIKYDYLVVAVGAESQTFGIKGVKENGLFLKELSDGKKIRSRLMDCIETAGFPGQPLEEIKRLLHMVVVGGGPTGVEYAGELYDFLHKEIRKWYPEHADKLKITLIEALPNVLPMFSKEMIEYTESSFKDMNIDIVTNTAVKEVKQKEILVQSRLNNNNGSIPYGLLVWATGNTARPLIKSLMGKLEESQNCKRGLLVDEYLKLKGVKDIWALGDCTATQFAPTAQVASQQGQFIAKQLNYISLSERIGKNIIGTLLPFAYNHRATLAYIGDDRGVADIKLGFNLPYFGDKISFSGYRSYIFWRSAYLSNLFTIRNKSLVAFDWTKEKIFGRDISRE